MNARHHPKIRGVATPPQWLLDHTERNMHATGPSSRLQATWLAAGLEMPDLPTVRAYRLQRIRAALARTNPWYQEASAKTVETGELMAFDVSRRATTPITAPPA